MDKETRNLLFNTTQAIRRLLEEEFSLQLEGTFDVHADGRIAKQPGSQLSAAERLVRCRIVEAIQHRLAVGESAAEAVRGFQSEGVFTLLNRLAALKMMEARALVLPCVSQGDQSQGFKEFSGLAPGLIELPDKGYRLYLECLFDEIGREVGVLFDRTDAASQLWPRRKALEAVLAKLNTPELAGVWAEDETIGWIYQYYNDPEERKQMREESSAPRNSRELAVRNQFFTPRYVVEFLTDNTLGRIWYEMTKGQTRLKDQCRYLVRRPTEIFLTEGQASPTLPPAADNCSQEDLLRQPVHIPHRPLKDPREIRMIDPACGSMHFGLYAFDLFTVIYDEAWEMAHGIDATAKSSRIFAPFVTFVASFADKAAFLREVPRLIVEHNIHGIDIDPRAAQIAGLALWLRAQRGWQVLGLKSSDRPPIRRSNVVCAEPMPGEKELLREFVEQQFPQGERSLFQSFLENVWDKMRLAGEAGSLLKIEEEIRNAIEDAREAWRKLSARPMELFSASELNRISSAPELTGMDQAVSSLAAGRNQVGADFWEHLEERIYAALRDYAEQAENNGGFQRRLFAEDAARGFAFIDVCRKRYDVALMNPPFGEFSKRLHRDKRAWYPNTWQDILAAFTERFFARLTEDGLLGAITSRTGFFLPSLVWWRQEFLVRNGNPALLADLGDQVMDGATVESAAYVIARCTATTWVPFFRFLGLPDRQTAIREAIVAHNCGLHSNRLFCVRIDTFKRLRQSPLAYWVADATVRKLEHLPRLVPDNAEARQGLVTGDSDRFVRVFWEVPSWAIETAGNVERPSARWFPYVMRGSSQPWFSPLTVVVNWERNGFELRNFFDEKGELRSRPRAMEFYFRPGFSWTRRAVRFVPYLIPSGCIPSASRYMAYPIGATVLDNLGLAASNTVSAILRFYGEWFCRPNFLVEHLKSLPWASAGGETASRLREKAAEETKKRRWAYTSHEPFPEFIAPSMFRRDVDSSALTYVVESLLGPELDGLVAKEYGLTPQEESGLLRDLQEAIAYQTSPTKEEVPDADSEDDDDLIVVDTAAARFQAAVSYILGVGFGRWDIRYATGEQAVPELPDPFAPLPVCPPGQLQNAQGLPARPEDVPAAYPVRIPWDGILLDDPNHPLDLERCVREVIEIIWSGQEGGPTAEAIEHEACEILGVKSLRDYFRKPAGFFADHLKRYSKSRRQAPIYWPLSSPNGLYTVWLYYHRLTPDTLFTVLRDHVKPKLEYEERQAFQLRQEAGATPSTSQRRDIAEAEELVEDLRAFKAELDRVAPLFRPDLNDGVIINHAPLWRMIGLPKWRKDCQATWNELAKGDYDWAHLALHLWPERVIPKCATDRSLAIAHGLDAIFWREDPEKPGKWIARKVTELELRGLIAERTSAAVKAAVESLVGATSNEGAPRKGRKGAKA